MTDTRIPQTTAAAQPMPAGNFRRRQVNVVLADVVPALLRHGEHRLAAEVEQWNSDSDRTQRGAGLMVFLGFSLSASVGIGAWGIRSGFWEWTAAASIFSAFILLAMWWIVATPTVGGPVADE